jgi:hypothetical protein
MRMRHPLLAAALVAALASCTTQRTVGQPSLSVVNQPLSLLHRDKVDILFMIDNSPSMAPKQAELRARFAGLVKQVQGLAMSGASASFHIGVVDSDLGAGPFNLNQGQCHPDGDGGKLRTAPSPAATDVPSNCAGWALTDGAGYIDYDSANNTGNTGALSVSDAFNCLASVGQTGCGFESPLESVYRVLTTPSLNPGFLRDDALLVVVFLTDEDDCSAPPDTNLFDPSSAGLAMWGTLHSFRCTQFGIHCDEHPLDSSGTIQTTDCKPVDGGPLFDVGRYQALFANGGVKANAADVMLVSIAAPATPVTFVDTTPCQDQTNTPSCLMLAHSCVSPNNQQFFGDPAVRLAAVVGSSPNALTASICDDDYEAAVASLGDSMGARMLGCLPGAVVDVNEPGCTVTVDGADTPRCDGTGTRLPCWDLVEDMRCPQRMTPAGSSQTLRFTIEGGNRSSVSATCPLYEPST